MPQHRLITTGPYAGRILELPDDIVKAAEKDGWAVDTTGKDYDPFNTPIGLGAPPYAPSLQAFLDGLAGGGEPAPKAKAAPEKVEPKAEPKPEPKPEAKAAAKVDAAPAAKAEDASKAEDAKGKGK